MIPFINSFFGRIAVLGGARNLAVQTRTISAAALLPPCASFQNSEFIYPLSRLKVHAKFNA